MSMNGTIRGFRGGNLRNGKTTFPNVIARQERAAARKLVSDARTPEQQLAELNRAGLTAAKERAKLAGRIIAREEKSKKTAPAGAATVDVMGDKKFKKLDVSKIAKERGQG